MAYKQTSFSVANGNYKIFDYGGSSAAGEFEKTSDYSMMPTGSSEGAWMGVRTFIDSYENANSLESTPYCAVFVKPFYSSIGDKLGYISTDIKLDTSLKALESINLGEGSTFAFITPDGVETNMDGKSNPNETIFANTTFFDDVKATTTTSGFEWMKDAEDGNIYLYVFAKVGESGAVICGRVPDDVISAGVKDIRTASVIAIILATVVSAAV